MTLDHSYLLALGQWKEKTRVLTHETVICISCWALIDIPVIAMKLYIVLISYHITYAYVLVTKHTIYINRSSRIM